MHSSHCQILLLHLYIQSVNVDLQTEDYISVLKLVGFVLMLFQKMSVKKGSHLSLTNHP